MRYGIDQSARRIFGGAGERNQPRWDRWPGRGEEYGRDYGAGAFRRGYGRSPEQTGTQGWRGEPYSVGQRMRRGGFGGRGELRGGQGYHRGMAGGFGSTEDGRDYGDRLGGPRGWGNYSGGSYGAGAYGAGFPGQARYDLDFGGMSRGGWTYGGERFGGGEPRWGASARRNRDWYGGDYLGRGYGSELGNW